jgi:predicted Ser/Thr protein kinase
MISCPYCGNTNDDNTSTCRVCGASLTGAKYPTALVVGTKLQGGKYVIERALGQGGFGITYKANNASLGIPVVVKEFHPQGSSRAGNSMRPPGTLTQQEFVQARASFADEAKVVAQLTLNNPNPFIVRVYDVFTENDTEYYTMEFLDGKPLQSLVEKNGPLSEAQVLEVARQLGGALQEVHQAGLLHRDVKPDNVMMVARGAVLIDFGSARAIAAGGRQSIIVTPGYAPLEQYASEAKRGPFTDVYAMAGTLFFALTGQPPIPATDRVNGTKQPNAREVNPSVSKATSDLLERAMRMKIDERPQSAAEFLTELERAVGGGKGAKAGKPTNVSPAKANKPAAQVGQAQVAQAQAGQAQAGQAQAGPAGQINTPAQATTSSPASTDALLGNVQIALFIVFGAMILLGQFGVVDPQVATIGFYLVALLSLYIFIQWLLFTRSGRGLLLIAVGAIILGYYAYTQNFFR